MMVSGGLLMSFFHFFGFIPSKISDLRLQCLTASLSQCHLADAGQTTMAGSRVSACLSRYMSEIKVLVPPMGRATKARPLNLWIAFTASSWNEKGLVLSFMLSVLLFSAYHGQQPSHPFVRVRILHQELCSMPSSLDHSFLLALHRSAG